MRTDIKLKANTAVRITLVYLIFSIIWILFTDNIILYFTSDLPTINAISNIKGLLFVIITSIIIYVLIHRRINEKNQIISDLDKEVIIREQLIRELHHRIKNNMQVFMCLLDLESSNYQDKERFLDSINSKLLSMISIFNIVYDLDDMRNISLEKVLSEYKRISLRNIQYFTKSRYANYSIEIITSLMLVIDTIINSYYGKISTIGNVLIEVVDEDTISITLPENPENKIMRKEDMDYIDVLLVSISGNILIEAQSIVLSFSAKQ